MDQPIGSEVELKKARTQYCQWDDYSTEMLRRQFDSSAVAEQYAAAYGGLVAIDTTLHMEVRGHRDGVEKKISCLESIKGKLELYDEVLAVTEAPRITARGQDIFVVHGHDEAAKHAVARFIEKLGLRAIVLHEQADGGRTIIEKLEEESSEVGFAVVLLTPDDIGAPGDQPHSIKSRARQNVVFELGFFVGRLDRNRVCVLHKGDVDIPTDYQGVIYVPMDEGGAWQIPLAKEMSNAGIDLNLNRLVED